MEEVNSVFSRRVSSLSSNASGTVGPPAVPSFATSGAGLASSDFFSFSSVLFLSCGVLRLCARRTSCVTSNCWNFVLFPGAPVSSYWRPFAFAARTKCSAAGLSFWSVWCRSPCSSRIRPWTSRKSGGNSGSFKTSASAMTLRKMSNPNDRGDESHVRVPEFLR